MSQIIAAKDIKPRLSLEPDIAVQKPPSRFNVVKNASVLSIAITLYVTASLPCAELQSSVNIKDGIGVYSEAIRNCGYIIGYLILPIPLMSKIGIKYTLTFGILIITLYYMANMYVTWGTMIPAAFISSFGNSPVWPAKASYLTILSDQASTSFNIRKDHALSLLFGFFYSFYYFGYIGGNIASYYILQPKEKRNVTEEQLRTCGIYFRDSDAINDGNANFIRPDDWKIYTLFSIFIGVTLLAALNVALFMDPVKNIQPDKSILHLISKTLRFLIKPKQLLFLPLGMSRSISSSFLTTEYTKAFISCAWGMHNIALVMISYGVVCGISSLLFGRIVRYTGRIPLFVIALITDVIVAIFISQWHPKPNEIYLFFVVPILMGFSHSIWLSQVVAFLPLAFPNDHDIIFAINSLSEDLGGAISRSYSATLSTEYKLIIYMTSIGIAFMSYIVAEFKYLRRRPISS